MAEILSVTGTGVGGVHKPAVVSATSSSDRWVTIDPDIDYTLVHLGVSDDSGTGTTAPFFYNLNADVADDDYVVEGGKGPVQAGMSVAVGPGVSRIYLLAASEVRLGVYPGTRHRRL